MPEVIEIIEAKRDGRELSAQQITSIVNGFTFGAVPDYQMSAFLMACYLRGLSDGEAILLTRAMLETGESLNLSSIDGVKIDKHSTGGIGDKISLALVPILAAAGVKVAKMSGRGLGNTGGTLDKLESIEGFNVSLTGTQIVNQVAEIGACLCAQTSSIVPADKLIYALRDVTGTVESIPLIAASVMSKKLAGGADIILLDVKVGSGAFVKTIEKGRELANLMRTIGSAFGKTVVCELTSMDAPLGQAIGNLIEVIEAADLLRNKVVDSRFKLLVFELADNALKLAGGPTKAIDLVGSGAAWRKFCQIVEAQGGDIASIDRWYGESPLKTVHSLAEGYITAIDADVIGRAALKLGAGRVVKDQPINPLAGIHLEAVIGARVEYGTTIASLYGDSNLPIEQIADDVISAFIVGPTSIPGRDLILETIPVGIFE